VTPAALWIGRAVLVAPVEPHDVIGHAVNDLLQHHARPLVVNGGADHLAGQGNAVAGFERLVIFEALALFEEEGIAAAALGGHVVGEVTHTQGGYFDAHRVQQIAANLVVHALQAPQDQGADQAERGYHQRQQQHDLAARALAAALRCRVFSGANARLLGFDLPIQADAHR